MSRGRPGWAKKAANSDALTPCLGPSTLLTLSSQLPFFQLPIGASSAAFLLDLGTSASAIDLAAFPSPGPSTSGCEPTQLGVSCTVAGVAFFGPPGPASFITEDLSGFGSSPREAGIVGTDFTSLKVLTLDYSLASPRAFVTASGFCTADALLSARFAAESTHGFYASDLSTLVPFSTVRSGATGRVPNIPTVAVKIAGTAAVAQLDTGLADTLVPFGVNVNGPYYDAIVAADPSALVREPSLDLALTTCTGVAESVEAYSLTAGRTLAFVDDVGSVIRAYPGAKILVKRASPAACGGIGTWTVPAAQVGSSFFLDMGALVFDPFTSRVWIPRD